jgi:hypothetical protein
MRADGTAVMAETFDHVQWVPRGQDRAIVARAQEASGHSGTNNGLRWGAVDGRGNIVIPLQYDWLSYYRDGYAMFKLNGKEGRIDRDGNVLSEEPIQPSIADPNVRLAAVVDGKSLFTDKANTRLLGTDHPRCPDGRHLRHESGSLKVVRADESPLSNLTFEWVDLICSGHSLVKRDGRWGYLTADGGILGDRYYDHANEFYGGIATVTQDQLWAVIDEDGKFLLGPLKLARGAGERGDGAAFLVTETGHLVLDKAAVAELARDPDALTRPLPPRRFAPEGLAASYDAASGRWGFTDVSGAYTIAPRFDAVGSFNMGVAWAAFPEKREWCLIDKHGQARSDPPCQCGQPLVIIEHYSPPANVPCYDAGLAVVGVRK